MIVPITKAGEMVLLRQYRYAVDEWCLEVPAGGTHDSGDASLEEVARKELREEVGPRRKSLPTSIVFFLLTRSRMKSVASLWPKASSFPKSRKRKRAKRSKCSSFLWPGRSSWPGPVRSRRRHARWRSCYANRPWRSLASTRGGRTTSSKRSGFQTVGPGYRASSRLISW